MTSRLRRTKEDERASGNITVTSEAEKLGKQRRKPGRKKEIPPLYIMIYG